eukprot:1159892-Pelagomonas_calceolata.AAC.7
MVSLLASSLAPEGLIKSYSRPSTGRVALPGVVIAADSLEHGRPKQRLLACMHSFVANVTRMWANIQPADLFQAKGSAELCLSFVEFSSGSNLKTLQALSCLASKTRPPGAAGMASLHHQSSPCSASCLLCPHAAPLSTVCGPT